MKATVVNNSEHSGVRVSIDKNGHEDLVMFIKWSDFWQLCRFGNKIDTTAEVKEYLSDFDDSFSEKEVGEIVRELIDIRLNNETQNQIFDAIEKIRKKRS